MAAVEVASTIVILVVKDQVEVQDIIMAVMEEEADL